MSEESGNLFLKEEGTSNYIRLQYLSQTHTYTADLMDYDKPGPYDQIAGNFKKSSKDKVTITPISYNTVVTGFMIVAGRKRNFYPYKAYAFVDRPEIILAIDILLDNPYEYISKLHGFNFRTADSMAQINGIPESWPPRIRAGIPHFTEEVMRLKGSTVLPIETLTGLLRRDIGKYLPSDWHNHSQIKVFDKMAGIRWVMKWEERVFRHFASGHDVIMSKDKNPSLGKDQLKAYQTALGTKHMIVTGGAGTGKTTLIKALYEQFSRTGNSVVLCAFTGKAARRMTEVVGHTEAKTIHRTFGGGFGFWATNSDNTIEADVVIVDEASMLSSELMYRVINGSPPEAKIILIGDPNQLPPISMGCPFADLIKHNAMPIVKLNEVFRTAKGSMIAYNAAQILNGNLVRENNPDWTVLQYTDVDKIKASIVSAVRSLHARGDDIINDLMILTPNKAQRMSLSTMWLNKLLHKVYSELIGEKDYNGYGPIKRKVMQVQNNYSSGLMNGMLGVELKTETSSSLFGDSKSYIFKGYGPVELDDFETKFVDDAYAMTVHKAQGSEAPFVLVIVHSQGGRILNQKWFYTAVTRAKNKVIIIGDSFGLNKAVKTANIDYRTTYLQELIKERDSTIPF